MIWNTDKSAILGNANVTDVQNIVIHNASICNRHTVKTRSTSEILMENVIYEPVKCCVLDQQLSIFQICPIHK